MDIAAIKDLIASVGFPGAIILYLMWMGKGLLPWVERFVIAFEGMTKGIEEIKEELSGLRLLTKPQ